MSGPVVKIIPRDMREAYFLEKALKGYLHQLGDFESNEDEKIVVSEWLETLKSANWKGD